MNKWIQGSLARNRAIVRILVLLMAICSLDTMQLVLCHEDGAQPRVEQALNGQCLVSAAPECSLAGCDITLQGLSCQSSEDMLSSGGHSHCTDCADVLLHARHLSPNSRLLLSTPRDTAGGCLYKLLAAPSCRTDALPVAGRALDRVENLPRSSVLVSRYTQLLI